MIIWYSRLECQPIKRAFIISMISLVVMAHTIAFCLLMKSYVIRVSGLDSTLPHHSLTIITLPIMLLLYY